MDNWNAPQWADFNASLMSDIDDYFDVEHKELEPRHSNETTYGSFTNSPNTSVSNSLYDTPKSNGFASPAANGASKESISRLDKTGECLARDFSNLQLKSAKKALGKLSMTPNTLKIKRASVSAKLENSGMKNGENNESKIRETESCSQVCKNNFAEIIPRDESQESCVKEKSCEGESVSSLLPFSAVENNENATTMKETETIIVSQVSENNFTKISPQELKADSACEEIADEENTDNNATLVPSNEEDNVVPETVEKIDASKPLDSKIAEKVEILNSEPTKLPLKSVNPSDSSKNLILEKRKLQVRQNKATVATSKLRRYSIAKNRRRSNQYVSLAEAVERFHNGPSKRFCSTIYKDNTSAPHQKLKQTKMKLTCPMSPALLCKTRTRATSVASQDSQSCFKPNFKTTAARSLNLAQQKLSKTSKKNEKISTKSSKQDEASSSAKMLPMFKQIDKMLVDSNTPRAAMRILKNVRKTPGKKTVPTIVSNDEKMEIKDVEILHFGIPVGNNYKKITRTIPFSFDTRNKEIQSKKEKLKNQKIEEEKSRKSTFHARPVPSFNSMKKANSTLKTQENNENKGILRGASFQEDKKVAAIKGKTINEDKKNNQENDERKSRKTSFTAKTATFEPIKKSNSVLKSNENNANNKVVIRGLNLQERKELAMKKKEELMGQIVEQEKRARIFHAKPAPNFKPVFVRGRSAENLRSADGNKGKRGISPGARQKGLSQESIASSNQENTAPNFTKQAIPKLKNSLMTQNLKVKKSVV